MDDLMPEPYYSSPFFDSEEEEMAYYEVLNTIPMMGSNNYRSALLSLKFDSSCEDMTVDGCRCIEWDEEQVRKHGGNFLSPYTSRYNVGMVWSSVMAAPDSTLFGNEEMRSYI